MSRKRLDAVLAERGLFETRSRAAAAVLAGDVRLGEERRQAEKPGQMVAEDVALEVAEGPRFVSRGGQKLENALDAFGLDPAGRMCLALVKPQFEVGRERVGKGGVVRGADDRRSALVAVGEWALAAGHAVLGYASSGLPGPAGNRETFVWLAEAGRAGARTDVEAAAREVEP